jgi:hypothetical protein
MMFSETTGAMMRNFRSTGEYMTAVMAMAATLIVVGVTGCNRSENSKAAENKADAHDHDHDHEHLEHFVPAHKPADFESLVLQLTSRFSELSAAWNDANTNRKMTLRNELADIIGWIPELAADSELLRKDFESAVETGQKIQAQFETSFAVAGTQAPEIGAFEPLLKALETLIPASKDTR